jgi:hypothetical protein
LWITDIIRAEQLQVVGTIGFLQGGTATTDNFLVAIFDAAGNRLGPRTSRASFSPARAPSKSRRSSRPSSCVRAIEVFRRSARQRHGGRRDPDHSDLHLSSECSSGVLSGAFGTVPAVINPPTTFTAGSGPIVYLK